MVRLASSWAWNVPSKLVKNPSGRVVAAISRRTPAITLVMSRCLDVREHDHASPSVFPQDLVRPVGLPDVGNLARRNPADRCLDEEIAKPLRRAHAVGQPHSHVKPAVAIDNSRDHAAVGEAAELSMTAAGCTP